LRKEISENELPLAHFDPHTKQFELEVQKIIHLQNLANQMPEAFTDLKKVIKSHVSTANAPIRIDVREGQHTINKFKPLLKRSRSIDFKDKSSKEKRS
jgi:hypothetical protein